MKKANTFIIYRYKAGSVDRVSIRRATAKHDEIDAPAAFLEAYKAEIISSNPGAVFIEA